MKQYKNNDFRSKDIGKKVTIYGWVHKKRNLGGLLFLDIRDRSGIIQALVRPEQDCYKIAETLKNEYVVALTGDIKMRENKNPNMETGEIELEVSDIEVLNVAKELPFEISDTTTALEDTRLKYRYLDLRRNVLKKTLMIRHKIMTATREFLNKEDFIEIETPILCKSTPEGARDYLVPSRISKGKFYALPQSPQLFKQLLMIGGMERYYQIAKCFRDEDLRADRQPEFTQIDLEMSFVDQDDIMELAERLIAYIFEKVKGIKVTLPLLKMEYNEAIERYGSDQPDVRFDMQIEDITPIFQNTEFTVFKKTIEDGGIVNAIVVKNVADQYSRKNIDSLTEFVKKYGSTGLAYLKLLDGELSGSIAKVLSKEEQVEIKQKLNLENNDLVLIVANKRMIVKTSLGALRLKLGKELHLMDPNDYKMLWIVNFPVFEYSEEEGRYLACHHPFTAPHDCDVDRLMSDPGNCYAKAYDIVINGYEAGGGSIRIHNAQVQTKMFEALGFTRESAKEKFGFFIDAFDYGTPPHGGLAFGLDRLTMLLSKTENIRDVIAFPKTASASDMMSEAPNVVEEKQLEELGITIVQSR